MEKYLKRKSKVLEESSQIEDQGISQDCLKHNWVAINFESLPSDPGLRKKINDYHPNDWDEIRRRYLQGNKKIKKESIGLLWMIV